MKETPKGWWREVLNAIVTFSPLGILTEVANLLIQYGAAMIAVGTETALVGATLMGIAYTVNPNWTPDDVYNSYAHVYGVLNTLGDDITTLGSIASKIVNTVPALIAAPVNYFLGLLFPIPSQDELRSHVHWAETERLHSFGY